MADKIITLIHSPQLQAELIEKGTEQLRQFGSAEQRTVKILALCKTLVD